GVEVRLKNMPDDDSILLRGLQIEVNVPLRIDYYRVAIGSQHVRRVRQTSQIELLEIHEVPSHCQGHAKARMRVFAMGDKPKSRGPQSHTGSPGVARRSKGLGSMPAKAR